MRIQSINYSTPTNFYKSQTVGVKSTKQQKEFSFKGYESLLREYAATNFSKSWDVSAAFLKLCIELQNQKPSVNPYIYKKFTDAKYFHFLSFLDEISKPSKFMNSATRDLLYMSADEPLTLYNVKDKYSLTLYNKGKYGFLNNLFDSENAKNNVSLAFDAPDVRLELYKTKNGDYALEQYKDNFWQKSIFDGFSNDLISRESGSSTQSIAAFYP